MARRENLCRPGGVVAVFTRPGEQQGRYRARPVARRLSRGTCCLDRLHLAVSDRVAAVRLWRHVARQCARQRLVARTESRSRCRGRASGADHDAIAGAGSRARDTRGDCRRLGFGGTVIVGPDRRHRARRGNRPCAVSRCAAGRSCEPAASGQPDGCDRRDRCVLRHPDRPAARRRCDCEPFAAAVRGILSRQFAGVWRGPCGAAVAASRRGAAGRVSNDAFLAGYGAAQAVPGPLFTFSADPGTANGPSPNGWAGAILRLVAMFLPRFPW